MAHITGTDRAQVLLLPDTVDDYVGPDNPVRFIDAFVDSLDLAGAGFERAEPKETGRPGYDPSDLLKLYIYGYLNRVRSSRRLEAETHRNLEVIWLLRRLRPNFKTIADFRRENREAFRQVFRDFVKVCRSLELFGRELIAVDGNSHPGLAGLRFDAAQERYAWARNERRSGPRAPLGSTRRRVSERPRTFGVSSIIRHDRQIAAWGVQPGDVATHQGAGHSDDVTAQIPGLSHRTTFHERFCNDPTLDGLSLPIVAGDLNDEIQVVADDLNHEAGDQEHQADARQPSCRFQRFIPSGVGPAHAISVSASTSFPAGLT